MVSGSPSRVDGTNDSTMTIGVRVEEHVLHERVGIEAAQRSEARGVDELQLARLVAKRSGWAPGGSSFVHAPVGFTK